MQTNLNQTIVNPAPKISHADILNDRLGVNIFIEHEGELYLKKMTRKEVLSQFLDDLITKDNNATNRLLDLIHEILSIRYDRVSLFNSIRPTRKSAGQNNNYFRRSRRPR